MTTRQSIEKANGLWSVGHRFVLSIVFSLALAGSLYAATGSVDPGSGWYPAGTNVMVLATPTDVYSRFNRWMGDTNETVIVNDALTIASLSRPRSITAVFVESTTASNAVPYRWLNTVSNGWTTVDDFESAVTNDHDGDSFTTAQEYWSGTDPFSDSSYLHIAGVEIADGKVRLRWNHDRVDTNIPPLCVQVATDLVHPDWQDAAVNTNTPVEGDNIWEEPYSGSHFYRLIVPPAP